MGSGATFMAVVAALLLSMAMIIARQRRRIRVLEAKARHGPGRPAAASIEPDAQLLTRLDVWLRQLMMSVEHEEHFHDLAAAAVLDLVSADTAALVLLDHASETYSYAAALGTEGAGLAGTTHALENDSMFTWAASHAEALRIADKRGSTRTPHHFAAMSATSALVTPILEHETTVGFLVAFRGGSPFQETDEHVLTVLARKVAIAMENRSLVATLEAEKERAEVTLHSIGDAVVTTDADGYVDYLNPVAERLTGWTNTEAQGVPIQDVFRVLNEVTREPVDCPVSRCLQQGSVTGIPAHSALVRRDGREFSIDDSAAPIRERDGPIVGAVLVFHDVSRSRRMARQLSWHARHDQLTGLANRAHFEEALRLAVDNAREDGHEHVVLYVDLDQFKVVNDTCGHVAGDELVRQLSAHLRSRVRELDTLARLGGDEFGVLLIGCPPDQGRRIAATLLEHIHELRFRWEDRVFELGASIGVATITSSSASAASVLSAADIACHVAKEKGRNRIHVFCEGDSNLAKRRGEMMWVSRITSALEAERFELYAQPIVPTSGAGDCPVHHLEVLVRMRDENGELVSPGQFIPAAERYNLMGQIDRWVVKTVCRRFSGRTASAGLCAVNLSGASLSDETLLAFIREQLARYHIPPSTLCFEITETAAVANLETATRFISELKALGCRFALDDFGSGLSSFAYLKQLPVDFLKIDGFFVKDMRSQPMNRAIVEAIQRLGESMGIQTIAEFVEDDATLLELREIGVDYGQGYGIRRPAPLEELLDALSPPLAAVA